MLTETLAGKPLTSVTCNVSPSGSMSAPIPSSSRITFPFAVPDSETVTTLLTAVGVGLAMVHRKLAVAVAPEGSVAVIVTP